MFPVLNKLGAAMDDIAEQTAVQIRKELDQKGISTCFAKFSSEIKQISTQLDVPFFSFTCFCDIFFIIVLLPPFPL